MGFDANAAPGALQLMWTKGVPPHSPAVHAQLIALGNALRAIDAEENAQRVSAAERAAAMRAREYEAVAQHDRSAGGMRAAFTQLGI